MKIVIVGAGSVGRYMAEQLVASGNDVSLIDNDAKALNRADRPELNACSAMDANCPRWSEQVFTRSMWWRRSPETTRTTWWWRFWRSRSSRSRGSWPV